METATELKIDELDWYINGLQNDLRAVKNAIIYPYNNGLAEGSVNKIKLTKRIMYGRCFIESKTTHKRIFSSNQLNLERTAKYKSSPIQNYSNSLRVGVIHYKLTYDLGQIGVFRPRISALRAAHHPYLYLADAPTEI